jgi:uncharacterized protein (TIGR01777 family)
MRVIITGATGFIGKALCRLLQADYQITALSRDVKKASALLGPAVNCLQWDARSAGDWVESVDGCFAVVNLAGDNIASGRWTESKRRTILDSRLNAANAIIEAIRRASQKPQVLIQASAVGYYGTNPDREFDESGSPGTGFLADVCRQWEAAAKPAESLGVRLVIIRSGVVLDKAGGALPRLVRPFQLHFGGPLGGGEQWVSWIGLHDEIAAIRFLMEQPGLSGVFNLTAPQPVPNRGLAEAVAHALGRRSWAAVPAVIFRLALGQMADEMLLYGQKVLPNRLLEAGFEFRDSDIRDYLKTQLR